MSRRSDHQILPAQRLPNLLRPERIDGHAKMPCQENDFKICNPATPQFDPGQDVSRNIPALDLESGYQFALGESPLIAQAPNLWSNDVAQFLHCGGFDTPKIAVMQTCFVSDTTQPRRETPYLMHEDLPHWRCCFESLTKTFDAFTGLGRTWMHRPAGANQHRMAPMTLTITSKLGFTLAAVLALIVLPARAALDNFGSGVNAFAIDFVIVGNAGNSNDAGAGGGLYSLPYGGVSYTYRMGVTEVSQDWITKATNLGLTNVTAGAWTGNQPAANITWYEAAAFVNFLNTSTGHQAAYNLNGSATALTLWTSGQAWQAGGENLYRHKDAYYFLPNENEWYKTAFHQNDGLTANYWDYATGSNTIPAAVVSGTSSETAVYNGISPANVATAGGLSAYGTMGQDGNIGEFTESAHDGINDSGSENRTVFSSDFAGSAANLRPTTANWDAWDPASQGNANGFRVASVVPEPSSVLLVFGSGLIFTLKRRRALPARE